jgi:hypothetical protein
MKTDFKKLTAFEGALVAMIVLGVAIIGFEIFTSLPTRMQVAFADAVQVFDMQEPVVQQAKLLEEVSLSMVRFYDEFNLAFIQTMAMGDEFNKFSDLYESAYEKAAALTNTSLAHLQEKVPAVASAKGLVLGAMTTAEAQYATIPTAPAQEQSGCGEQIQSQVSEAVPNEEPAYEAFYFSDYRIPKTVSYFLPLLTQN